MQIVIDIPEEKYIDILRIADVQSFRRMPSLEQVIANGTPLPKHGRLIDADALIKDRVENDNTVIIVKCAPTIIEADTEYEVWNSYNGQRITAPKGTFAKIYEDCKADKE